ncbi:dimethyl sulfoxide reductase anchor subunit family protein [Pseudorhodobacter sp.]|uniref:dimethyl sulfoxide reductase anchor subunit family protein n=1 Tax=Pseudorhodobacter sp. TaxID=1934400 RepID=UPI002AFE5D98|nr:DmsC/YnfH family molybdoenzyme membrane anchor subunit [Pseudorhodobacter sp.]
MHPAPSVIIFSVLSGLGFGFMAFMALGFLPLTGVWAFWAWGVGYALAVGGLIASTAHLGNPQRALKAFSQWRSSWLSREGWAAVLALFALAPIALGDWLGFAVPFTVRGLAAALALVTVVCTAMIYTQIKAVPRWHHWLTPVMFVGFALAGGALLALQATLAFVLLLGLAVVMLALFYLGDRQFARAGATMGTATGLGGIGEVSVFEHPHTGGNYLLREMIFVVGRRHALKLRVIAVLCAAVLPALMAAVGGVGLMLVAVLVHLVGAFAARWLFFAEAEHVVGLYYGKR